MSDLIGLENLEVVNALKAAYAFDGGAEREHNGASDSLGFGLLHYAFVRNLQPDYALAIGSRYGFVPACIALALKANGKGRLHFVDANYNDQTDQFAKAYGGTGHWSRPVEELFGTLQLHEWIELFVERTDTFFPRSIAQYGYIYIDGNHSYQGVAYDFGQAISHLTAGGLITVHDALVDQLYGAAPTDPGGFGIKEYLKNNFPEAVVLGRWPGLAVVQPHSAIQQAPAASQPQPVSQTAGENGLTDKSANLETRLQEMRSTVEATSKEDKRLQERLAKLEAELKSVAAETRRQLVQQDAYYELIARIRNVVGEKLPPNATVLVVSRGDDQMICFARQRGWHFPRTADGLYAGEHPADSTQAIATLEHMRTLGAQYLLFPQTSFWWMESYPEFKEYLKGCCRIVVQKPDTCVVFALQESPAP